MRLPDGRNVATRQAVHGRTIDTKLLIYGLFQKGRVLAQDGVQPISPRNGVLYSAGNPTLGRKLSVRLLA